MYTPVIFTEAAVVISSLRSSKVSSVN